MNQIKNSKNGTILWPKASSLKQEFILPDSIMYYVTRNPSTPKCYLKMAQSCKYFFEKKPLIVALRAHEGEREICLKTFLKCLKSVKVDLAKITDNTLWITGDENRYYRDNALIYSKIYRSYDAELAFMYTTLTLEKFYLIASKFRIFYFSNTQIVNTDGFAVMLETVVGSIPKIKEFRYWFNDEIPTATISTIKKLSNLKQIPEIRKFVLHNIPEIFAVQDLADFIEIYKNTKFWFRFRSGFSQQYKNQLEELIDKIVESKTPNCVIYYDGQDGLKLNVMIHHYHN